MSTLFYLCKTPSHSIFNASHPFSVWSPAVTGTQDSLQHSYHWRASTVQKCVLIPHPEMPPSAFQLCVSLNPVLLLLHQPSVSVWPPAWVCTKWNEIMLIRALYWGWIILISQSEHDDAKQLFNFFVRVVCDTALSSTRLFMGGLWQSHLFPEYHSMHGKGVLTIASLCLQTSFQDIPACTQTQSRRFPIPRTGSCPQWCMYIGGNNRPHRRVSSPSLALL